MTDETPDTTGHAEQGAVAAAFEAHRGRLTAMAQRMLGSRADAEDAVQEAWLRLTRQDPGAVENLAGWLTTVVGRLCLDMLRSRKTHAQENLEDDPTEVPAFAVSPDAPEDDAVLADSVGLALLVVLDCLRPAERMAFVLHDLFGVPFDEIGQILGKSTPAAKMLASRARRKVRGGEQASDRRRQRAVVDAFLAAAREGDFEGLLRLLDPDVRLTTHTAQGAVVKVGAAEIAAAAIRGMAAVASARAVLVDGLPGLIVFGVSGRVMGVTACEIADDRIVAVRTLREPTRLAEVVKDLSLP